MDGSRTTPGSAGRLPTLGARARGLAATRCSRERRREQLRLLSDSATRTAAARVVAEIDAGVDAFDALYLRYAPYVAAIGARLLGRDDELDDLVQDVFMQLLRGLSELRDPAAFKGFLAQITIRSAARRLRKRCLRRELPHEVACMRTATPEQRMLCREVYTQLDALAPTSRAIWVLRHVEGEPLHVIAARIGCSLSTVQRRLSDAQSILADRFVLEYAIC